VVQAVPQIRQNVYSLSVDINKPPFHGVLKEGEYDVHVYIGDTHLDQSVNWPGVTKISVIEEEDTESKDYEPVNDEVPKYVPKEPIEHTFSSPQSQPFQVITMIFNGVVLLPLLVLLFQLFVSLRISLNLFQSIYAIAFVICLVLNCIALFMYWYQWNIFDAMFYLFVLAIPTTFFGYSILKNHLNDRIAKKNK